LGNSDGMNASGEAGEMLGSRQLMGSREREVRVK
jgi:hypothetical protein